MSQEWCEHHRAWRRTGRVRPAPQLKIVAGRSFTTGLRELIVGRGVVRQFQGRSSAKCAHARSDWTVVGVFESGDAHDSELWTDINVARTTFGRNGSSSVLAALEGPMVRQAQGRAGRDPRVNVDVVRSRTTSAARPNSSARPSASWRRGHPHHGARRRVRGSQQHVRRGRRTWQEIATLRAIGFGGLPVLVSVSSKRCCWP